MATISVRGIIASLHGRFGKLENAIDELALFLVQMPAFFGELDELADFVFRVNRGVFARGVQAEKIDGFRARPVQRVNKRLEDFIENLHRQCRRHRDFFG